MRQMTVYLEKQIADPGDENDLSRLVNGDENKIIIDEVVINFEQDSYTVIITNKGETYKIITSHIRYMFEQVVTNFKNSN